MGNDVEQACMEALSEQRFEEAVLLLKKSSTTLNPSRPDTRTSTDTKAKPNYRIETADGVLAEGMRIEDYEAERAKVASISFLNLIFTTKLLRHLRFDQNAMPAVQISASMMFLSGKNKLPRRLLEHQYGDQLDILEEARILLSTTYHITGLQSIKQAGFERVQISSSSDKGVCVICRSENQKIYAIDSCPLLPHESCTCEAGCGCYVGSTD